MSAATSHSITLLGEATTFNLNGQAQQPSFASQAWFETLAELGDTGKSSAVIPVPMDLSRPLPAQQSSQDGERRRWAAYPCWEKLGRSGDSGWVRLGRGNVANWFATDGKSRAATLTSTAQSAPKQGHASPTLVEATVLLPNPGQPACLQRRGGQQLYPRLGPPTSHRESSAPSTHTEAAERAFI